MKKLDSLNLDPSQSSLPTTFIDLSEDISVKNSFDCKQILFSLRQLAKWWVPGLEFIVCWSPVNFE